MLSIIVATAKNRVIGKDNKLIWHLPADLKRFKQLTMGHHVIMGRKTFESIGKALPGRKTIIITRQKNYEAADCVVVKSLPYAIELCRNDSEAFITGGAQIYELAIPMIEKIYLTRIHHSFEGDAFFPELNKAAWKITFMENHKADEKNPYDYSFVNYERI